MTPFPQTKITLPVVFSLNGDRVILLVFDPETYDEWWNVRAVGNGIT